MTACFPRFRWLPAALVAAAAGLSGCQRTERTEPPLASNTAAAPAPAPAPAPTAVPPDFTSLMQRVGPAVVNVTTSRAVPGVAAGAGFPDDPAFDFFRRFMPGPPRGQPEYRSQGVGSGFVIDAQGYVLTNAHVVEDADEVLVKLPNGKREHKAQVVGADLQTDVALLKVDAQDLPVVTIGKAADVAPGEWVAAIGSPFGFASTITAGIVSAKERALPDETYVPFIQTDVAINPGNSGGPLLNTRGEVVGINSMIYSRTGGYMGLSFAIPIDVAMDVANQLRTTGRVTRGRLGIGIQPLSAELAQSFKLAEPKGALVTQVEPGSPAQQGGLAIGDVILSINGEAVESADTLPRMVAGIRPGTEVPVEVWRNGASQSLKVTVGASPDARAARTEPAAGKGTGGASRLGVTVSELPPAGRRELGVDYGLVVEDVQGANAASPLQPGDVIVALNHQRFKSLEDFRRLLAQVPAGTTVAVLVRRGHATVFVPLTVSEG